jgi:hypothetical protein
MTYTDLDSELRHLQHGYAWARRVIAGAAVCLLIIAGIADSTTSTSAEGVSTTPAPHDAPSVQKAPDAPCPAESAVPLRHPSA